MSQNKIVLFLDKYIEIKEIQFSSILSSKCQGKY